jgi:tetratricopeptide (TPR) repeat protein
MENLLMNFKKYIIHLLFIICFSQITLAVDRSPVEQEAIDFYNEGVQFVIDGKYEESILYFDKAIVKIPKFMKAYYTKGRILGQLKRYDDVIKNSDAALKLNIKQPRILTHKSVALYALKKYKEGLKIAQLAVQYGNDVSIAYEARANAYAALGHYELAVSDYDKTLELVDDINNSNNAETYLNRFCPLYNLGRYLEALETCDKALAITTTPNKLPQIYSKKAAVLNKLGRHNEALEDANKALEISLNDPLGISEKKIAISRLNK